MPLDERFELCNKRFDKLDERMENAQNLINEIGNKLSVLKVDVDRYKKEIEECLKNNSKLNVLEKSLEDTQQIVFSNKKKMEGVSENIINIAAYQNIMVDKLASLIENESNKKKFREKILIGVLIVIVSSIIIFIISQALSNLLNRIVILDNNQIHISEQINKIQKKNKQYEYTK